MAVALTDPAELTPDQMATLLREQAAEIGKLQADVLFFTDMAGAERERADQLQQRLTVLCRERQDLSAYMLATVDRLAGHARNGRTVRVRAASDGVILPIERRRCRRYGRARRAFRSVARFLVHWRRVLVDHRDRLLQLFPFLCAIVAVAVVWVWGG